MIPTAALGSVTRLGQGLFCEAQSEEGLFQGSSGLFDL